MPIRTIPLDRLQDHPLNANAMPGDRFAKLRRHLERTRRYPPLIVRPVADDAYQLLDGHHRARALRELGHATARCDVWEVDEDDALVLLATLNRLEGRDDPRARGRLLGALRERLGGRELPRLLPEDRGRVERLTALGRPSPPPRPPVPLSEQPVCVHFFLLPAQRRVLDAALCRVGGPREQALMRLIERAGHDLRN